MPWLSIATLRELSLLLHHEEEDGDEDDDGLKMDPYYRTRQSLQAFHEGIECVSKKDDNPY